MMFLDQEGWTSGAGGGGVLGDQPPDRAAGEVPAGAAGEQWCGRVTAELAQPHAQHLDGEAGQRSAPLLPSLAFAPHPGA